MKKGIILIIFVIFLALVLSTCASVKSQGISYFIGKSESDLIKHFGYNGVEIESSYSEYDKVIFFTNKILQYQMSKTSVVRNKNYRETEILNLSFNQFPDGCLNFIDTAYNSYHYEIEGLGNTSRNPRVIHRNDNSAIIPRLNEFNNMINRNRSFPYSQHNEAFNRSNIGDSYYLYLRDSKSYWHSGVYGLTPEEAYTSNIYILWKIDIVAEDRSETDRRIVVRYNERLDSCYDGNGNTIPLNRANSIINSYTNDGWTLRVITEGNSMFAYIKNGKVIRVEERKDQ